MNLPKLVRDKIPSIIEASRKKCAYYIAGNKEYEEFLYKKMSEELEEFIESPSIEEAADMYEVFLSILRFHKIKMSHVEKYRDKKNTDRGGFLKKIILQKVFK